MMTPGNATDRLSHNLSRIEQEIMTP